MQMEDEKINLGLEKVFDQEGVINFDVAKTASEILDATIGQTKIIKMKIKDKRYLVTKEKKSIPWLEDGVDKIIDVKYFVTEKKYYFEVEKSVEKNDKSVEKIDIRYFVDAEWNYLPWFEKWFQKYDKFIKKVEDGKCNIFQGNNFVMPEWADKVTIISEAWNNNRIVITQFGDKKSFMTLKGSNIFVMNKNFDNVTLLNNALHTKDSNRNTSFLVTEDNKQYIYNQDGELISRATGIDISLGVIIWHDSGIILTKKWDKKSLLHASDNHIIHMWSEDGSDKIVGLHDEHVNNRYFLVTEWAKTKIYTSRWNLATKYLPEWFDNFIGIKDVIIPDPDKYHPHPLNSHYKYVLVKDWVKTFLLPIDFGGFWDGMKWFETWFDSIEPLNWERLARRQQRSPMTEKIKNQILLNSYWFPFMIVNEWKKFVFDKYARPIKGLEDGVDNLVVLDDIVIIKNWGQSFILDFVYEPIFKWKESWFDDFRRNISNKEFLVSKGWKNFVYNSEKNTFTEIVIEGTSEYFPVCDEPDVDALIETYWKQKKHEIFNNFFAWEGEAPDELPF